MKIRFKNCISLFFFSLVLTVTVSSTLAQLEGTAQLGGTASDTNSRVKDAVVAFVEADMADSPPSPTESPTEEADLGSHGFAQSGDVRIHYVTKGEGPLVVMIHGFPDYWYTWRKQMPALSQNFQVVAIDQRGYNQSDQPTGVEDYAMQKLVGDVENVIKHFKREQAIVIGHDWGGMVAWQFAMTHPKMTERLVILNLPHPNGLRRELANNPEQQKNSAYARFFQTAAAASMLKAETLLVCLFLPLALERQNQVGGGQALDKPERSVRRS